MKLGYILGWIVAAGIILPCQAQDTMFEATAKADTTTQRMNPAVPAGEEATLFSQEIPASGTGGCALIQNKWKDRKVEHKKNGYVVTTANEDEIIEVKNKGLRGRRIIYYNDYESLNYHLKKNGKLHYKYDYENGCKKVRLKRKKNGEMSMVNKSGMDFKEVRTNLRNAMAKGVETCSTLK